jgi:hypothetical protein
VLPEKITLPAIEEALMQVDAMGLCKNRLWSLINVSDRKQSDLPDIMAALESHSELFTHKGHNVCTPNKCQWLQMDSTKMGQLYKKVVL